MPPATSSGCSFTITRPAPGRPVMPFSAISPAAAPVLCSARIKDRTSLVGWAKAVALHLVSTRSLVRRAHVFLRGSYIVMRGHGAVPAYLEFHACLNRAFAHPTNLRFQK